MTDSSILKRDPMRTVISHHTRIEYHDYADGKGFYTSTITEVHLGCGHKKFYRGDYFPTTRARCAACCKF